MTGVLDDERFRKLLFSFPDKAVQILYDRYYGSLIRVAWSFTHDQKVSEDIVQEALVHVWENCKRLGQPHAQSIQYYLVRVIRNKSVSFFRKASNRHRRVQRFYDAAEFPAGNLPPEHEMIRLEVNQEIRQVIDTFPRRERECLLMKLDEGMTVAQIAVQMNVSNKAVERSMTSASKRLRLYWERRR